MVVCYANASESIAALNQPMVCKIDLLSFPAVITVVQNQLPREAPYGGLLCQWK